ncbi:MAG: GNAT family N-acetyltransferase [Acidobacteriota bacterium]
MNAIAGPVRGLILRGMDPETLAEPGWDGLAARSETTSVFQTSAWLRSWWATFHEAYEPRVLALSRGHQLVGLAPLVASRRTPGLLKFMGDGRADYCDLIAAATDKRAVVDAMFTVLEGTTPWSVLDLSNVPGTSNTTEILREFCTAAGFGFSAEQQYVCPTLLIHDAEESALKIFNKASLRRPENVLARSGRVTYRTLTGGEEVAALLDGFFEQHVGRWSQTTTPSLFSDARNRDFYRALAANLGPAGWLHFSVVDFEGRPIAYHFGFDFGGTLTWYKPSFAIGYAARSPGMILLRHLIGDAITRQRSELDFTVGDEAFKRRFSNCVRVTQRIRVFREPSQFLLDRSKRAVVDAAKWISKRSPVRLPLGRYRA